jgi:hypothetical protein
MLIADDNKDFAYMFQACISANNDIEILESEDADQTCSMRNGPAPTPSADLVMHPWTSGSSAARNRHEAQPNVIIVMSALATIAIAVARFL